MTQETNLPSAATRRTIGGSSAVDGEGLRGEQDLVVDRDRDEQSDRRQDGVARTAEQVADRVRATTSNPWNASAVNPDMSKVVTAWFAMAGDVVKLQQQFFADMLGGAGNTNARVTTKV